MALFRGFQQPGEVALAAVATASSSSRRDCRKCRSRDHGVAVHEGDATQKKAISRCGSVDRHRPRLFDAVVEMAGSPCNWRRSTPFVASRARCVRGLVIAQEDEDASRAIDEQTPTLWRRWPACLTDSARFAGGVEVRVLTWTTAGRICRQSRPRRHQCRRLCRRWRGTRPRPPAR